MSYFPGYILAYRDIGLGVRVFANGPGDLGSIPGRVIPKTQKMVLDASLLNTQHYKVRVKGKVEQSREGVAPSPTPWCSSYRKGSLRVTLDYSRQLYLLIYIYIYIYIYHLSIVSDFSCSLNSIIHYYYIPLLRVYHTNISDGFSLDFEWQQVSSSLGLFSIFWPVLIMLSFGWFPFIQFISSPPVPVPSLWWLFRVHHLHLLTLWRSCAIAFSVLQERLGTYPCCQFFISFTPRQSPL